MTRKDGHSLSTCCVPGWALALRFIQKHKDPGWGPEFQRGEGREPTNVTSNAECPLEDDAHHGKKTRRGQVSGPESRWGQAGVVREGGPVGPIRSRLSGQNSPV